jgi:hypothetical protein
MELVNLFHALATHRLFHRNRVGHVAQSSDSKLLELTARQVVRSIKNLH